MNSPADTLKVCQHKPVWCLRDRNTLAGLKAPCSACADFLPRMRELFGWTPEKPGSPYYISTDGLTLDSQRAVRKAIADRKHEEAGQMKLAPANDTAVRGMTGSLIIDDGYGQLIKIEKTTALREFARRNDAGSEVV